MTSANEKYAGRWLYQGEKFGQEFDHHSSEYEHNENADGGGSVPMRHAFVDRNGSKVGVWVPADWTDEQAREALDSNW